MIIKKSEFIISAVKRDQYPTDSRNEIAFVGRYAKVSKKEKESWGKTIEMYLTDREELKRVILLVDSRHKPTADDIMMYEWIKHFDYDCIVIATKSDKLSNNELAKSRKLIKETLGLGSTDKFYFFSSLNKKGKDELIDNIFEDLSEEARD